LSPPKVVVGIKRIYLLTMAGICFGLGCVGALLPGLPATPFLLLTSFFLLRSSPKLNARLRRSKMFGPILRDWEDRGGVRTNVKAKAVLVVAVSVGLTVYIGPPINWLRWLVVVLAVIGVVVIWRLPAARPHKELTDSDSV